MSIKYWSLDSKKRVAIAVLGLKISKLLSPGSAYIVLHLFLVERERVDSH